MIQLLSENHLKNQLGQQLKKIEQIAAEKTRLFNKEVFLIADDWGDEKNNKLVLH